MPVILKSQRAVYLAPLTSFYNKAGGEFPEVAFIHGEAMPEPYKHLLVHHSDMTPRLQDFHRTPLALEVMALEIEEPVLTREVILRRGGDQRPVEFGAIQIHLNLLPPNVAQPVREAKRPLGGILGEEKFEHLSAPRGYFRTRADALMGKLLGATFGETLYGRCNVLALMNGKVFAEIVEILPPTEGTDGPSQSYLFSNHDPSQPV
ncbi:MAG: chorismate-pyruvate lyase [Verrucomicrobiales bacterium]|jgi:chorismate-pyruvate lyase